MRFLPLFAQTPQLYRPVRTAGYALFAVGVQYESFDVINMTFQLHQFRAHSERKSETFLESCTKFHYKFQAYLGSQTLRTRSVEPETMTVPLGFMASE